MKYEIFFVRSVFRMNEIVTKSHGGMVTTGSREQVYVTVYIEDQLFGIPVEKVQDILITENIADVPLAPEEVAGVINLRGRIVTVIEMRKKLGLPSLEGTKKMCVTVEQGSELYSLMVDNVGSVLTLPTDKIEPQPNTLDPRWRGVSDGVVRLKDEIMIVFDINALLKIA